MAPDRSLQEWSRACKKKKKRQRRKQTVELRQDDDLHRVTDRTSCQIMQCLNQRGIYSPIVTPQRAQLGIQTHGKKKKKSEAKMSCLFLRCKALNPNLTGVQYSKYSRPKMTFIWGGGACAWRGPVLALVSVLRGSNRDDPSSQSIATVWLRHLPATHRRCHTHSTTQYLLTCSYKP